MGRTLAALLAAVSFLVGAPFVHAAPAQLQGVTVIPAAPTECDPIAITVTGDLPNSCYQITDFVVHPVLSLPCLDPSTPLPCPSEIRIDVIVQEPNPDAEQICPTVVAPYERTARFGHLPPGPYLVTVREAFVPFYPGGIDTAVWNSSLSTTFTVTRDSICVPGDGCYILGFHGPRVEASTDTFCDVIARPGGNACLDVHLMNHGPVGGVQTAIQVIEPAFRTVPAPVTPLSVEAIGRAAGFQVGWLPAGVGKISLLLYSTSGATIPPGDGPVLRVCWQLPTDAQGLLEVFTLETIVADPDGESIPPCPTLTRIAPGIICVASTVCDVNNDGASDVLDVIRLVRCALGTDCPDTVRARADCNSDGSVDIRDVVCCVRKIVSAQRPPATPAPPGAPVGSFIGFSGPVLWTSATEGFATVRIDLNPDWGGVDFRIDPRGSPVRITGMTLEGGSMLGGTSFESAVDAAGVAQGILVATTPGLHPMASFDVRVALERNGSGASTNPIRLVDLQSASSTGLATNVYSYVFDLYVPEAAAPALLRARPNPFASQTEISFVLPGNQPVTLAIFDVNGRLVRTLVRGTKPSGLNRVTWDGRDDRGQMARSGIYFSKLSVNGVNRADRILLLR